MTEGLFHNPGHTFTLYRESGLSLLSVCMCVCECTCVHVVYVQCIICAGACSWWALAVICGVQDNFFIFKL